jgi:hypothetical protein
VFFMNVGFVMLETGNGRAKNVRNVLLKNLVDVMLCALLWWAVGYAFAYGKSAAGLIGYSGFFLEDSGVDADRPWFFSWTFCVACVTIVSGCLAERTRFAAYPVSNRLQRRRWRLLPAPLAVALAAPPLLPVRRARAAATPVTHWVPKPSTPPTLQP